MEAYSKTGRQTRQPARFGCLMKTTTVGEKEEEFKEKSDHISWRLHEIVPNNTVITGGLHPREVFAQAVGGWGLSERCSEDKQVFLLFSAKTPSPSCTSNAVPRTLHALSHLVRSCSYLVY